ncbi:hypothetical protein XBLMG947_3236 [Xanthomonas bromi]|uniref:Uncharacterized protein n=1 Tax=Xanthomonas bromi TaxID=56449 RepID=A0A1C3NPW2_9XANT|nr:hypothetical protein [Xanthomonas bromi]SBV52440.1 hypothetical protein XBLMG947_3236 [Xanthomonas bromi]
MSLLHRSHDWEGEALTRGIPEASTNGGSSVCRHSDFGIRKKASTAELCNQVAAISLLTVQEHDKINQLRAANKTLEFC